MLVFDPGSTLKLFNASLFVQNQGSALQMLRRAATRPIRSSSPRCSTTPSAATPTTTPPTPPPAAATGAASSSATSTTSPTAAETPPEPFPVDGKLGLSGASDVLSIVDHALIRYGGGAVPQTIGTAATTRSPSSTAGRRSPTPTIADSAAAPAATPAAPRRRSRPTSTRSARTRSPAGRWSAGSTLINNSINGILHPARDRLAPGRRRPTRSSTRQPLDRRAAARTSRSTTRSPTSWPRSWSSASGSSEHRRRQIDRASPTGSTSSRA